MAKYCITKCEQGYRIKQLAGTLGELIRTRGKLWQVFLELAKDFPVDELIATPQNYQLVEIKELTTKTITTPIQTETSNITTRTLYNWTQLADKLKLSRYRLNQKLEKYGLVTTRGSCAYPTDTAREQKYIIAIGYKWYWDYRKLETIMFRPVNQEFDFSESSTNNKSTTTNDPTVICKYSYPG